MKSALGGGGGLRDSLGIVAPCSDLEILGWIVDTSIECDHQRFEGYLKVSVEELIVALRDERHLLQPPASINIDGEGVSNPDGGTAIRPPEWSLYPEGFTAARLVEVVHAASVWEKVRGEP